MTPIYYESHVTIEPVAGNRLREFEAICKANGFRVATLLLQNRVTSDLDSFCTGRGPDYNELHVRMVALCHDLKREGFKLWRYKIESALLDSKYDASLIQLDERASQ